MADGKGESQAGLANGGTSSPAPSLSRACHLADTLRALEDRLREDEVSVFTSSAYCSRFFEVLLQHTEDNAASEGPMLCSDVYETALRSFANASRCLSTECDEVTLLFERLLLSCFEVVLSMSEDDLSSDPGERMKMSILHSHDMLVEFGNKHLQLLTDSVTYGAWTNPVLVKVLSRQPVDSEEVNNWILEEGLSFLQLRIKHLMKTNCIQQAMLLCKACCDSEQTSSDFFFRQSYITCLCTMLPDEEAFKEISKMTGQEILDTICNLESDGQINTAFILCTTYLTQQLQNEVASCSWELTLFWSKLQRRIDPCLNTFLERCRQFGVIAKTRQHLFFLIKVVHTEAGDEGVPVSIMLCIRALQIASNETDATKNSVCKTIACLLPQDLEVRRACQLTEFLFEPTSEGLTILEELYLQPDQKNVEESSVISNSLRCELLLALKSHWLFDPEFWDWKTIKRHCLKSLGKEVSDTEEEGYGEPSINEPDLLDTTLASYDEQSEQTEETHESNSNETENVKVKKPVGSSERYKRWLQYKFYCVLCNREVIEARILHHAKMHLQDDIYTCPVCIKKFKKKEIFVPHVMAHMKMPMRHRPPKKNERRKKQAAIAAVPDHNPNGYIPFGALVDKNLQDRDVYPCPGTDCSRVFKQFKYLSIHLKAEHKNNDENAKHYLDLKNMREKCGFCRRHFITNFHLSQHMRIHIGSHPFMCVSLDCNSRFRTVNELLHHKHTHLDLQYKCELQGCHLVFSDLGLLYHHEAQHFRDAAFTCTFPRCKKFYYCSSELQKHTATHLEEYSENHFEADLLKNLKSELDTANSSLCNNTTSSIENNMSCKPEPESVDLDEKKPEQIKTENCLLHGTGSVDTVKSDAEGQADTEKPKCTCEFTDPANAVKPEDLHSSSAGELLEKPEKAEGLCSVAKLDGTSIKLEEEEIPTSDGLAVSVSSEDTMFELLTRLKQLNLKNADSCVQETVADSSCSPAATQNGSAQKQEKGLSQYLSQLSCKPFSCEYKDCKSAFVTKAALLLHYCNKHGYTKEKALKLHMFQRRYSPFECHICQRRFTRRTLLRIHYKNDHHIMKEKTRPSVRKFDKKIKPRIMRQKRRGCWEKLLITETSSQSNDGTSPLPENFNSETFADSLSDETDSSNTPSALKPDDSTSADGRGSKRVVDKDKSCYTLNKYHKPFHCIHKTCDASFTSQRGLVRHYQLVHQYNRESLCLEKDKQQNKKETNKCRKIFTCRYEECRKSFICGRALSKHYKEFHVQSENEEKDADSADNNYLQSETEEEEKFSEESESDESVIYCDVEGCTAMFTDHRNYSRHVMTRHQGYNVYEGRKKRTKKAEGNEDCVKSKHQKRSPQRKAVKVESAGKKVMVEFKSREEALKLCILSESAQFPCMVYGCSSVVKLESSILRHYKLTHHINPEYVHSHIRELVYCVKEADFSSRPESPKSSDHSEDYKITRLSLRSSNISTSNERGASYKSSNNDLRKNGSVERDFYGTAHHKNSGKKSDLRSNRRNEDRTSKSSGKENVSSFYLGNKERGDKKNNLQDPAESDSLDSEKCDQQEQIQAAIGLTNFKPMGFESSFLKFLQESKSTDEEEDDDDDDEDEDDESDSDEWNYSQKRKRKNSVQNRKRLRKDQNEREICLSLGKTSSEPTLENLRTMLDKALTDCGDLALKQLHQLYQKPVVVLERSDFTAPLIDLFSSKKTDQLCVGIS